MRCVWIWGIAVGIWAIGGVGTFRLHEKAIAASIVPVPAKREQQTRTEPIRPRLVCPDGPQNLVPLLLQDLPSYTNRVLQRSRSRERTNPPSSYVLLAGRPEFEPLTLGPGEYTSPASSEENLYQVFFTTLERQYVRDSALERQHYHWLFLARTQSGWQLALLFSSQGSVSNNEPSTPPQDSSQGAVAQAIRLWLRDCQAGDVGERREERDEK